MKVTFNVNNFTNNLSFRGCYCAKDDMGFKVYEFSYPFDENNEDCYLEVFNLSKDDENNYYTTSQAHTCDKNKMLKLSSGINKVDLADKFGIGDKTPFAYHFVLVNKYNNKRSVRIDVGDSIDESRSRNNPDGIYNIVVPTNSGMSRGGSMKLVIVDSQKVGTIYNAQNMIVNDKKLKNQARNGVKTIANKFGGTLAGLEKAVDNGEYDSYSRIISLPIFTDDDFTAHAYWNKNCFQMVNSLGNINNYASLQRKMFAHGLNFVSDGAFVNEGLQGVHFKDLLKWGEKSPYFNWFKAAPLRDNPLSLGIFPKDTRYVSHKVVNSPYKYKQDSNGEIVISKNSNYDRKKPTYIQYFDNRLVTNQERNDTKSLIKSYSKLNTNNVYELHTHNDSVFPFAFEIDPEVYNNNVKNLIEYNSESKRIMKMYGAAGTKFLSSFGNFNAEEKFESGFETWNANPEIAKLNFGFSNSDTKDLKNMLFEERKIEKDNIMRGNYQVRDYVIESGKYWTRKTDDILRTYVAQQLRNPSEENPSQVYNNIKRLANGKVLPKSVSLKVSEDEVQNVLSGLYESKRVLSDESKQEQILRGVMNTPLDSIEFGDNIVSVLASPLVSKRASEANEIGVSRYDLYKDGDLNLPDDYKKTYEKMNSVLSNELFNFANSVLDSVDKKQPAEAKLFNQDEVTEYGKYVLPLLLPEITKYAIVKSLVPNAKVNINDKNGEISYDYNALKDIHLQTLGIVDSASPQYEASALISKIRSGLIKLDKKSDADLVGACTQTLKGTNLKSFQLADLIIDKTQSGLDWRIDATKDIADIESLENGHSNFESTWNEVIDFWKSFVGGVQCENPNSYIVAEVTDEGNLYNNHYGSASSKYKHQNDIVQKFLRETGITSTANYTYFFNDIAKIFTRSFEDGKTLDAGNDREAQTYLHNKFIGRDNPYLKTSSLDSILYSYTFIGNHDKPRALHCAALDMELFYSDLTYAEDYKHRELAYRMLNDKHIGDVSAEEVKSYDYSAVSPKAIAMAYAIRNAGIHVLEDYLKDNKISQDDFTKAFVALSKSVADLSKGNFMGMSFDPDSFGVKPFDVNIDMVLKQAKNKYNLNLPNSVKNRYADDVFQKALDPAISKLLGMMKYLVALPGMPTMFDGDDAGATGYDTKTKNMYLQNRQRIHDEWLDSSTNKYKKFIAEHKKEFDYIMSLRTRPELEALNNGAIFMLPVQFAKDNNGNDFRLPTILRQAPDGRMTISVLNTSGLHYDHEKYYSPQQLKLDAININGGKLEDQNNESGKIEQKYVRMDGAYGVGLTGLKDQTIFVNANDPNDEYYVNEVNGEYFIKRGTDGGIITIDDSALILYQKEPKNDKDKITNVPFTGNIKPSYQFVSKAYQKIQNY